MITASIVTYHTDSDELDRCLSALSGSEAERIWVIDNAASDATASQCARHPRISYRQAPNPGYGAAHNIAIREALRSGTDFHLVLNTDVSFSPDTLSVLAAYMQRNPDVGCVQPRIVNPDGSLQYTVRMLPTPLDLILRRFLPASWMKHRRELYELHHIDHSQPFNVPYHQGSFMMLRAEALRSVGLFDERFFMYPEDIDLTRRIHRLYRTMYIPDATVIHDHRAASYHGTRMLRIHVANMIRYFNKWGWFFDPERRRFNSPLKKATAH